MDKFTSDNKSYDNAWIATGIHIIDLFSEYSVEVWQAITRSKDGPQIVGQNCSVQLTASKTKHTFSPPSQKLHSGGRYFL